MVADPGLCIAGGRNFPVCLSVLLPNMAGQMNHVILRLNFHPCFEIDSSNLPQLGRALTMILISFFHAHDDSFDDDNEPAFSPKQLLGIQCLENKTG